MKAVSLFSGAGGFEIGFDRASIRTMLQVEQDPWCLEVLARHWPETECITDVRQVDAAALQGRCGDVVGHDHVSDAQRLGGTALAAASVDLVYGGWPCQDHSVAGKRAGLSGERSGLFYEFARVVRELRPRWIAAENVPGLLSSPPERPGIDFGIVLRTLVDAGYGVAWRILDGRWFGVPQRRRRPILVGCLGDARRAAQVLAVCESCGGHPAPRREAGQGTPTSAANSVAGTIGSHHGNVRADQAWPGQLHVAAGRTAGGHPNSNLPGRHHEDDLNLVIEPDARAVRARASGYRMDGETENFVVAGAKRASDGHHGHSSPRGDCSDNLIAFQPTGGTRGVNAGDTCPPIKVGTGLGIAAGPAVSGPGCGVRRLTPLECERLMGWPDEHTRWTADGREIPDSHRYRMCGNGVIATVAEWLGHRLVAVDHMMRRGD